ncbi:hypothetical protein H072_1014 [Dactylellina haptotyla CBS 200.50]|uniref:Uncharacterized protein n=1 Tax=Dactylellina haptotyla (strain CBS 200.50) TaxID=1284197 RepID=S8AVR1_DACHA|nr:hypothetical protein H072_1014 [Dactylellina haptotyla CBS 200.50]
MDLLHGCDVSPGAMFLNHVWDADSERLISLWTEDWNNFDHSKENPDPNVSHGSAICNLANLEVANGTKLTGNSADGSPDSSIGAGTGDISGYGSSSISPNGLLVSISNTHGGTGITPPLLSAQSIITDMPTADEQDASINNSQKPANNYNCEEHSIHTSNKRVYGKHMWEVHGIRFFSCRDCGWRTTRHDNLKYHKNRCKKRDQGSSGSPESQSDTDKKIKRVFMKVLQVPTTKTSSSTLAVHSEDISHGEEHAATKCKQILARGTSPAPTSAISSLLLKLASFEKEIKRLNRVKTKLEDDLEDAISDRKVWEEQCKRLRQEHRSRNRQREERV